MAYETAYVFAAAPDGESQLAGKLVLRGGSFTYAESWLNQPWAYPLDPANLPLSPVQFRTRHSSGVFGVFSDAGPDDWGRRVLLMAHSHTPENELERLLQGSGTGVGRLRFSLSQRSVKPVAALPDISRVEELLALSARVEARDTLSVQELALIEPGTSMGGARPKVSMQDGDRTWMLKLGRPSDVVDMPRLEYASMQFLQQHLQLDVPEYRFLDFGQGRSAFVVERFDRLPARPLHFISAHSLFNSERLRPVRDSRLNPWSYPALASLIRRYSSHYREDGRELFKRLLVNILLGNTDDDARNHALVYWISTGSWRLSPAFDMLPTVGTQAGKQALGVGKAGADSTVENALSYAELFGLGKKAAQQTAEQCRDAFRYWSACCEAAGMTAADQALVANTLKLE